MKKNMSKILYLDIETVPQHESLDDVDPIAAKNWIKSMKNNKDATEENDFLYSEQAGIYPFFGKIVCISIGWIEDDKIKLDSFYDDDEYNILKQFADAVSLNQNFEWFCGHNIIGFDAPYIIKRMLINSIDVPISFSTYNKKPWETPFEDTYQILKCGGFNSGTLEQVANSFGFESPKTGDVCGENLSNYWYQDKESKEEKLKKIKEYCEKDVETLMRVHKRVIVFM